MKRILLIMMLVLLPLQIGWAAGLCRILTGNAATAAAPDTLTAETGIQSLSEPGCGAICALACDLQPLGLGFAVLDWSVLSKVIPAVQGEANYQSPIFDVLIRPKLT